MSEYDKYVSKFFKKLNKRENKMAKLKKNYKKIFYKALFYSRYCDCFSRVVYELILNGDDNFYPTDLPNIIEILMRYNNKLYKNIMELEHAFD